MIPVLVFTEPLGRGGGCGVGTGEFSRDLLCLFALFVCLRR